MVKPLRPAELTCVFLTRLQHVRVKAGSRQVYQAGGQHVRVGRPKAVATSARRWSGRRPESSRCSADILTSVAAAARDIRPAPSAAPLAWSAGQKAATHSWLWATSSGAKNRVESGMTHGRHGAAACSSPLLACTAARSVGLSASTPRVRSACSEYLQAWGAGMRKVGSGKSMGERGFNAACLGHGSFTVDLPACRSGTECATLAVALALLALPVAQHEQQLHGSVRISGPVAGKVRQACRLGCRPDVQGWAVE